MNMKKRPSVAHFGRYIRETRKERGISIGDLAQRAGISKGNLSKIENGGDPQLSSAKMLCEALSLKIRVHNNVPVRLQL